MNDYAGSLTPAERHRLEGVLAEGEISTKAQMVVAIFGSLQGQTLEEYTLRVARRWRIGRALVNDGVVLFIFIEDRKMRLEVGTGLEAVISNDVAASILKDVVAPRLREGRFAAGIEAASNAIFSRVAARASAAPSEEGRVAGRAGAHRQASELSTKSRVADRQGQQLAEGGQANAPSIMFSVRSPSGQVRTFRTGPAGSKADVTVRAWGARSCSDREFNLRIDFDPKYEPPHNAPKVWEQFDLANDDNAKAVFEAALAHLMALCPPLKITTDPVIVKLATYPSTLEGRYIRQGSEWAAVEYNNGYSRAKKEQEAIRARVEEQRRREEAQRVAAAQEMRARNEAAKREFESILGKHGVRRVVTCRELSTNPFALEGERVAVVMDFEEMLERDKALFGRDCVLVASSIPARTFSTQSTSVVLIGQVIGKTEVKIPFGTVAAPHLRFTGVHFCREARCSEFSPQ